MSLRAKGYHWCLNFEVWEIAEWDGTYWWRTGDEMPHEGMFYRRIGKPVVHEP